MADIDLQSLGQRLGEAITPTPIDAPQVRYATVAAVNSDGTLDITIDGTTLRGVAATTGCVGAQVDMRCVVLCQGPLATVIGLIASTEVVTTNGLTDVRASDGGLSANWLSVNGGAATIASDGKATVNNINPTSTADASPTQDNGPALIVGPRSGSHIEIDQNEILAKSNATTGSTLYVGDNASGETHVLGSNVNINANSKIKVNNTSVFRTKTTTIALGNVSAGGGYSKTATPAAISGFTPIAIAGWDQTHNQQGAVGKLSLNSANNQIGVCGKNTSGSAWSGTNSLSVRLLYINNKFLYSDG